MVKQSRGIKINLLPPGISAVILVTLLLQYGSRALLVNGSDPYCSSGGGSGALFTARLAKLQVWQNYCLD